MDEEVVNRDRNSATVEREATRNQGSGDPMKVRVVDGSILEPEEGSEGYEKWKRCDYMVTSWILNSMSKELVEAFIYTASARELWNEITKMYGENNGPLIYHIQRKISSISQGNGSVAKYFTRLKKLWDELASIECLTACSCGVAKEIADITDRNKLMQFLMGLDESFEQARNQILLTDPLPSINKAYSMVIKFEAHKQIAFNFSELTGEVALFSKGQGIKKE
ncbi:uncharacterized protein LOC131181386 [Hevea brasiliensis]|uniref:uncharacterized protein LOC131181386 n=1 Tax=Hevea brasiliensis TaxID=3981 RepID=UPI0025D552EE|nr:uncharacterized protein LOC131181386 [Hevea brasiliensis]